MRVSVLFLRIPFLDGFHGKPKVTPLQAMVSLIVFLFMHVFFLSFSFLSSFSFHFFFGGGGWRHGFLLFVGVP